MSDSAKPEPAGRSAKMIAAAVIVGLLGSGALVWQASNAAFTDDTRNDGNSWTSGKVLLSDDRAGVAMFSATGLVPGDADQQCIEVTFDGDVQSHVELYTDAAAGPLGNYLEFDVELGAGNSCAAPGAWTTIFGDGPANITIDGADTLSEFSTTHTSFLTGAGTWSVSAEGTVRPYRLSYTLVDDNDAQDLAASNLDFIWEARND